MDENKENRVFIVKATETDDLYCFDQSCLEQIQTEHVYPNSTVELDTDTIEEVKSSECLNKMVKTCEEKSVEQSYEIVDDKKTANDATYCQASEDCQVTGIIGCIGVFVVHPTDGYIALHYISGNDGSEAKKLTNTRNIMNQRGWTDSDIELFLYINDSRAVPTPPPVMSRKTLTPKKPSKPPLRSRSQNIISSRPLFQESSSEQVSGLGDAYKKKRDISLDIVQKFFNKKGIIVSGKSSKMNYKSLRIPTEITAVNTTDIYNQALRAVKDTQSLEEALNVKPTVKTYGELGRFKRYIREIYST
tara:strand:+ start:10301 stop:11212 length:912 start_codon:yes stop_codon:yes gene_type:complete